MTRAARPRPPRAGDPYGIGPIGTIIGPLLSVLGLVLTTAALQGASAHTSLLCSPMQRGRRPRWRPRWRATRTTCRRTP